MLTKVTPQQPIWRINRQTLFAVYVALISLVGLTLAVWGLWMAPTYQPRAVFTMLALLAAASAIATTPARLDGNTTYHYHIGSAVTIAAVPTFGIIAAVLIAVAEDLCTWLIKPANERTWKKTWRQLGFNLGMHAIALLIAGAVLLQVRSWLGASTLWGQTIPWVVAALVYEEVNLWLLIGVLRLQFGAEINPVTVWREERWATQIDIILMAVGGGLLAFAIATYDWVGVAMFFLPIALSAYAFRLYVGKMQAHLDNLEQIVSERTKELAERTNELAEINQQKDAFLSVLMHDMMTPLANIQFCAEVIHEDSSISRENRHLSQLMLRSQHTMHNLVRNILDVAKLQAVGELPMHKAPMDLSQSVVQMVETMTPEAREKGITLHCAVAAKPLYILADLHQIERVLMNLISNAIKYTPVGGSVQVRTHHEGTYVTLAVQDTGYGIPADELPYLFERFRRLKQLEDKASGTGLGLTITKALVEQHGGEISVVSEAAVGSTFTVKFPLR
jgi:signal transduction histidine kinase